MTPIIEQILQQGLDAHQIGDFALAQASYEQILRSTPRQPETNHALGLLMMSTNQFSPAADCLKRALDAKSDDQSLWINYLDALISAKRFDEAGKAAEEARLWGLASAELDALELSILQSCIEQNMGFNKSDEGESGELINDQPLANEDAQSATDLLDGEVTNAPSEQRIEALIRCYEGSDFSGAEAIARQILKNFPRHFLAWSVLSVITAADGRMTEALEASRELVELSPSDARAHYNLGNVYRLTNELDKAEGSYRQSILLAPLSAETHNNLGIVLQSLKRLAEAEACFSESLSLNPAHFEAKYNMGGVLLELGRLSEAEEYYRGAIDLKPDLAVAYGNLAVALKKMGRLNEAAENFKLAIELKFDYSEAHFNLGLTLEDLGSLADAQEMFGRALSLNPSYPMAQAHLNHIRQRVVDFGVYSTLAEDSDTLGIATAAVPPWAALTWSDDPEQQLLRARRYAAEFHGGPEKAPAESSATASDRLRVAYFSADFHDFPGMYLMAGMLEAHDRDQFEIFAFSYGPDSDDVMRERIINAVDHFIDIRELPTSAVVDASRELGIDIAIHRNGYTKETRTELFQERLAPVQISYLGYPGTLGTDFVDYLVADPVVIPKEQRRFYAEKIIYLPNSYQPNDDRRQIAPLNSVRADHGLPDKGLVLCCFNQTYKISPREFDIWMRVMNSVDGSVLWLLQSNALAEQNLQEEAQRRGVEANRIIFAERMPQAEHLARHQHADLFIDTFNYNAHTGASDALWAGLPLVTKAGKQFAARVASSLLVAMGMSDLITETEEQYEQLIMELAHDGSKLDALKARVRINRLSKPLFKTDEYTRDFEFGLKMAVQKHRQGGVPEDIFV